MAEQTRVFEFYHYADSLDGLVLGDGPNGIVQGLFPLQVGDRASVFSRNLEYIGTDGADGAFFLDTFDRSVVYLADSTDLNPGDFLPDVVEEPLPLVGEPEEIDPVFSFADSSADLDEGDTGTTEFLFKVARSGPGVDQESSVDVAFIPEDPDAADFGGTLPETLTLTFAVNETEQTFTIPVSGDTQFEPNETFRLQLENPVNGEIPETNNNAAGFIGNDDLQSPPGISIAPLNADQDEGNDGTTVFAFVVARSGDVSGTSTVDVVFNQGDTDAGDFEGGSLPAPDPITFDPNENVEIVTINVAGDTEFEGDETFALSLQNPTGATINSAAATADGTIFNDDVDLPPLPTVSIAPPYCRAKRG